MRNAQVRIHPWDAGLIEHLRQFAQPALGLPLVCVVAPDGLVRVTSPRVQDDHGVFGDRYLAHEGAVAGLDRLEEREGHVLRGSIQGKAQAADVRTAQGYELPGVETDLRAYDKLHGRI